MTSEVAQPGTLWDALTSGPDHRRAEGKRYPLASLLLIAIAAMLSGRRDQLCCAAIWMVMRDNQDDVWQSRRIHHPPLV